MYIISILDNWKFFFLKQIKSIILSGNVFIMFKYEIIIQLYVTANKNYIFI